MVARCTTMIVSLPRKIDPTNMKTNCAFVQGIVRGMIASIVVVILGSTANAASAQEPLEKMSDGRGSKMFLFKSFPAFTSFDTPPKASGHMLSEPWHRAGHPPLLLIS